MHQNVRVIAIIVTLLVFSFNRCFADELRIDKESKYQNSIMNTGVRILNSNNIEKRMTFFYISENKLKTKINTRLKRIFVYKGVIPYLEDDNELAALLSIDIAHLMDIQDGFFKKFSVSFSPRKYELRADKKAVDLMVKSGYDPVALIILVNKTTKEQCWFEYNIFHHNGSERMKQIYQYIYEKYPVYLVENAYIENPYYQNFLRTTKHDRKKVRAIQEERLKKYKKIKTGAKEA